MGGFREAFCEPVSWQLTGLRARLIEMVSHSERARV